MKINLIIEVHCKVKMQRKSGNTSGMARHLEEHPDTVKAMLEKKSDTSAEKRKHTKNQSTWEDAFLGQ